MVKAFAGSKKLNVTKLDFDRLLDGKNAYTNSTTIRVDYKNTKERERFDGKFSANPSAKTISGSATGWTLRNYKTDDVVFRFTGRNLLSASVVLAAAKTKTLKDGHKIIEKMLAGNDSFDGSRFDDVLYGYRGDDTFQGVCWPRVCAATSAETRPMISAALSPGVTRCLLSAPVKGLKAPVSPSRATLPGSVA